MSNIINTYLKIQKCTFSEYQNSLKDANTIYFITDPDKLKLYIGNNEYLTTSIPDSIYKIINEKLKVVILDWDLTEEDIDIISKDYDNTCLIICSPINNNDYFIINIVKSKDKKIQYKFISTKQYYRIYENSTWGKWESNIADIKKQIQEELKNLIVTTEQIEDMSVTPEKLDRDYQRIKRVRNLSSEEEFRYFLGLSNKNTDDTYIDKTGEEWDKAIAEAMNNLYTFHFGIDYGQARQLFGSGMLVGWLRQFNNRIELQCISLGGRSGQTFNYPLSSGTTPITNETDLVYEDWDVKREYATNFLMKDTIITNQLKNNIITLKKIAQKELDEFIFNSEEEFSNFLKNDLRKVPAKFNFKYGGCEYEGYKKPINIELCPYEISIEAVNLSDNKINQWYIDNNQTLQTIPWPTNYEIFSSKKFFKCLKSDNEPQVAEVNIGDIAGYSNYSDKVVEWLSICIGKEANGLPVWCKIISKD